MKIELAEITSDSLLKEGVWENVFPDHQLEEGEKPFEILVVKSDNPDHKRKTGTVAKKAKAKRDKSEDFIDRIESRFEQSWTADAVYGTVVRGWRGCEIDIPFPGRETLDSGEIKFSKQAFYWAWDHIPALVLAAKRAAMDEEKYSLAAQEELEKNVATTSTGSGVATAV